MCSRTWDDTTCCIGVWGCLRQTFPLLLVHRSFVVGQTALLALVVDQAISGYLPYPGFGLALAAVTSSASDNLDKRFLQNIFGLIP